MSTEDNNSMPAFVAWFKTASWRERFEITSKICIDGFISNLTMILGFFVAIITLFPLISLLKYFSSLSGIQEGIGMLGTLLVMYLMLKIPVPIMEWALRNIVRP